MACPPPNKHSPGHALLCHFLLLMLSFLGCIWRPSGWKKSLWSLPEGSCCICSIERICAIWETMWRSPFTSLPRTLSAPCWGTMQQCFTRVMQLVCAVLQRLVASKYPSFQLTLSLDPSCQSRCPLYLQMSGRGRNCHPLAECD